jgi:hypothetical protein
MWLAEWSPKIPKRGIDHSRQEKCKKVIVLDALMRRTAWDDELASGATMSPISDR